MTAIRGINVNQVLAAINTMDKDLECQLHCDHHQRSPHILASGKALLEVVHFIIAHSSSPSFVQEIKLFGFD